MAHPMQALRDLETRERDKMEATIERYRLALERIANAPPRSDISDYSYMVGMKLIAANALEPVK